MTRLAVTLVSLIAIALLAGCKNMPGADGRYATHDHGANNRP